MRLKGLIFSLFCLYSVAPIKPGIATEIHIDALNKFVNELLPVINDQIKQISIDDEIRLKEITVKKSKMTIEPLKEEDIFIERAEADHFHIICRNVMFVLDNDVDVHWGILKSAGTVNTSGRIEKTTTKVTFKPFDKHDPRPYMDFKVEGIEIYPSNWNIHVDVKYIPNFIINFIINIFKSTILEKVLHELIHTINDKAEVEFNKRIHAMYPLQVDGPYNASVVSSLTESPLILNNSIAVEADGTFFDTNEGYKRTSEPDKLPLNQGDAHLIDIFVSEYSANGLVKALFDKKITLKHGFVDLSLRSLQLEDAISFHQHKIVLRDFNFTGQLKIGSILSSLEASVSGAFILGRYDPERRTIVIQVEDIEFDKFVLTSDLGILNTFSYMIKLFVQVLLRLLHTFEVKLPNLHLPYSVDVYELETTIYNKSLKLGVDFNVKQFMKNVMLNNSP